MLRIVLAAFHNFLITATKIFKLYGIRSIMLWDIQQQI
jgi:hypothetical protein